MPLTIAFYAPMKSPNHPTPSGDRYIGRLLMKALNEAGFTVDLISDFRAWEGRGDSVQQGRIKQRALQIAASLIDQFKQAPADQQPDLWFTYHLYHKAPDWIGPKVCQALGIPYFVAEASVSPKQKSGNWAEGYRASLNALQMASGVFSLNPNDTVCVEQVVSSRTRLFNLPPFAESPGPRLDKVSLRQEIALAKHIDFNKYWLICVGMMRQDAKLDSYVMLAQTIEQIERQDWQLLIIGSGPAELQVKQAFRGNKSVHFLGLQEKPYVEKCLEASDLMVWPAINEAFGMAPLEALAAGLPVVSGRAGGIAQIVDHDITGVLINNVTAEALSDAVEDLLSDPAKIAQMSKSSRDKFHRFHTVDMAARKLKSGILECLADRN